MRRNWLTGRCALLLIVVAVAIGPVLATSAAADPGSARTYPGPPYGNDVATPPTRNENQSRLWFHADAWWALLLEPGTRALRVYELRPDHTWRPTGAVVNTDAVDTGDALRDGDLVHVVSRARDESLQYTRLSFDPAIHEYRADPPLVVTTRGSLAPANIAKDGRGRLWIGYAAGGNVVVTYSDDGGRDWGRMIALATADTSETPELAAMVAFDDRIGILWSDQRQGAFMFATHRNGDLPETWTVETALAGPGQADNHISLKRVRGAAGDTLVAVVKTSQGDEGEPPDSALLEVLIRAPGGLWSKVPFSTVADGLDSPVLLVDEINQTLHVFATDGNDIVTKRAPIADIRFPPGKGDLFVLGSAAVLTDPTVTKDPVDPRSGIVVLTSGSEDHSYRHAELPVSDPAPQPDPDDRTPPTTPQGLHGEATGPGTVTLAWAESSDGGRWTPAANGVPVQGYVISRDGVDVETITTTSYEDHPRDPSNASETSIRYAVAAVDQAGNQSAPAEIVVDLPPAPSQMPSVIGAALLGLGMVAAGLGVRRRLALQR